MFLVRWNFSLCDSDLLCLLSCCFSLLSVAESFPSLLSLLSFVFLPCFSFGFACFQEPYGVMCASFCCLSVCVLLLSFVFVRPFTKRLEQMSHFVVAQFLSSQPESRLKKLTFTLFLLYNGDFRLRKFDFLLCNYQIDLFFIFAQNITSLAAW